MALDVRRIGYAMGAEVRGVDFKRSLGDDVIAEIRSLWLEHLLLCFPDQQLSPEELIALTARFGTVDDNRTTAYQRHPDYPEILLVANTPVNGKPWSGYRNGESWHSDLSTTLRPTSATLLLCKRRPSVGGDTMFANMYMAYESLSARMQALIGDLQAIHDLSSVKGIEQRSADELAAIRKLKPPVVHSAVRVHPETGRKALYVSPRVKRFVGMTEAESRPLVEFLSQHAVQDEFCYRHRWNTNDLVMWDNRCLQHKALGDYAMWSEAREMHRCCLVGERDGMLYTGDQTEELVAS